MTEKDEIDHLQARIDFIRKSLAYREISETPPTLEIEKYVSSRSVFIYNYKYLFGGIL